MKSKLLEHINKIEIPKAAELIIQQIRDLIKSGTLKPGDRLPSENALAKTFGVSRGQVREALKKLEFYGVLNTVPQIGTFVSEIGVKALEGVLSNVLHLQGEDYDSLNDTRAVLEIRAAELVTLRATDEEIEEIVQANEAFYRQRAEGNRALDEDIYFHLKIAEYAHSSVLASLVTLLASDIIKEYRRINELRPKRKSNSVEEHRKIVESIQLRDPHLASKAMTEHMQQALMAGKDLHVLPTMK
ncbi:GntR family transcriptional regulator [candidate division KSB3 bacterium]|uniref:GntR family transcriptional regulator n=1 Tax=candidate division KSB3 bacterium TaxID=2044937 RepID=A0A2G6K910_9BACT|nr:MAG: GntR family transcriptional regulator [candidate division KSB3 bacterium]